MINRKRKKIIIPVVIGTLLVAASVAVALALINQPSSADDQSVADTSEVPTDNPSEESEEPEEESEEPEEPEQTEQSEEPVKPETPAEQPAETPPAQPAPANNQYSGGNCTTSLGKLMLINPVFTVTTDFISKRKSELIDITAKYGIIEQNRNNGTPYMDAEAASHLNDMINAYKAAYPGHTIGTRSCFRSRGTSCGRLCYATGTTDHHSGYTCDLIDSSYGTTLNTNEFSKHLEWQWLKQNSYKYGFIDRFPAEWAGGSMSEPVNINAQGSTGLYETWHYRYVGIESATEIATGKYNNSKYDSLEHYLLARKYVTSLTAGTCNN